MSRLRQSSESAIEITTHTPFRWQYDAESEPFEAYAARTAGGPRWECRICYPVGRIYGGNTVRPIPWTDDTLRDALQPTLRTYRQTYGGTWELHLRTPRRLPVPMDRDPLARRRAIDRVLAGPDTPGRRFLATDSRGAWVGRLKTTLAAHAAEPWEQG